MNKKDLEKALKDSPNKDFYLEQINAQLKAGPSYPYLIYLSNFKVKSHNGLKGKWASTTERRRAIAAFNRAGVSAVVLPKKRCRIEFTRIIPPGGKSLDEDNMIAGLKWVCDQLTERGYIVDDSRKWVDRKYIERRMIKGVENGWGVKIEVSELS